MTKLHVVDDFDRDDDDFLAFWAEHRARHGQATKRILGVDVVVPSDIPLNFADRFNEVKDSEDAEDAKELLGILFGDGVLDQWIARGVTTEMMKVLTAWATANATGTPTDFAAAVELAARLETEKAAGKAPVPNRADRRASSKTRESGGTGRSSKPTSPASTASTRKRSPRSASAAS